MYTADKIAQAIKARWEKRWDDMHAGSDPSYDAEACAAVVREYDELLIEIEAITKDEAKFA